MTFGETRARTLGTMSTEELAAYSKEFFTRETVSSYLGLLLLLALSCVAVKIFWNKIWPFLEKKQFIFSAKQRRQLTRPIILTAFSFFAFVGMKIFGIDVRFPVFFKPIVISLGLGASFLSYRLVDVIFLILQQRAEKSKNTIDDIFVSLFQKATKVSIVVFALLFLSDALGFNVKGLVAGLGIGGLAFAFAAKDTISNVFGSLMVVFDRPFSVGDWVKIDGYAEGLVEDVGIRSTRIRTFYDSIISIPNGSLASVHIDNYGKRKYRRLSTKISIQYDTSPEKIEAFCEGIRQIIANHNWTRKDYFHVYLNELGSSSLDIILYVFWQVPSWSKELAERHRLLLDILRLGEELQVEFAFPTQTVHLFNENGKESTQREDIPKTDFSYHKIGKEKAERILQRPLSFKNERSGLHGDNLPDDDISL